MEPNYPQDLFRAVAQNILSGQRKMPQVATISKQANDRENVESIAAKVFPTSPNGGQTTPEQEQNAKNRLAQAAETRNAFLGQYGLTPDQFKGDPEANRFIQPMQDRAAKKINDYFTAQEQMLNGSNPTLSRNRDMMYDRLRDDSADARIRRSITTTAQRASRSPERFGNMVDLSNKSGKAFESNLTTEIATPVGAAAGAGIGAMFGKSPIQRLLYGAGGALAGGLAGLGGGRVSEEAQTGYSHGDVLKPFQVANRLDRRLEADQRVK